MNSESNNTEFVEYVRSLNLLTGQPLSGTRLSHSGKDYICNIERLFADLLFNMRIKFDENNSSNKIQLILGGIIVDTYVPNNKDLDSDGYYSLPFFTSVNEPLLWFLAPFTSVDIKNTNNVGFDIKTDVLLLDSESKNDSIFSIHNNIPEYKFGSGNIGKYYDMGSIIINTPSMHYYSYCLIFP